MGCGASKSDTELVKLCRERRDLITDARDSRDCLAFSHMAYLQSMQNLENGLKNFMEESIVICFNLNSDAGLEHPPVEAVLNHNDDDYDDNDDLLSLNNHVNAGHNPPETQSDDLVVPLHSEETSIGVSADGAPNISGLKLPLNGEPSVSRNDGAFKNSMFYQHERVAPQNLAMDIPSDDAEHYRTLFSLSSDPLQNEASTFDYINPFNVVEDTFHNFYSRGAYDVSSVRDDMDLRELWMREEGMPDLEDEFDESTMDSISSEDLEEGLSEAADLKYVDAGHPDQKEEVKSPDGGVNNIRDENVYGTRKEDIECGSSSSVSEILKAEEIKESLACNGEEDSFHKEMERSKACEGQESSCQTDETLAELMSNASVNGPRDLQEVLNEIKEAFDDIIVHGKDVSTMLGPYQPATAVNKGSFPSYIERFAASSSATSVRTSTDQMLKMAKEANEILENDTSMTSSYNLSLTLEKLCIWENKLYEEVKNEEKLREDFDKEWRKLKKLDDKGAESFKVEASHSALKRLTPRINVSISMIEGISTRTHKIRDEELQPQLSQLIQRMHKMWKFTFDSHEKQVRAITKLQANVETTCTPSESSLKATKILEAGIQNLGSAFSDWIKRHRAFPLLLNNWLTKFLVQEQGKALGTTSPSASPPTPPIVLAICTRWHKAVETVSESNVLRTLNNFKQLVHELCLNMQEEGRLRTKIEHLSSYHDKRLRNFSVQNGLDWEQSASFIREADSTVDTGFSSLHALYVHFKPIRINITEANAMHEEVMERVKVAAASILQNGLAPLLEALVGFSLEMYNAFEQISGQSEASSSQ